MDCELVGNFFFRLLERLLGRKEVACFALVSFKSSGRLFL